MAKFYVNGKHIDENSDISATWRTNEKATTLLEDYILPELEDKNEVVLSPDIIAALFPTGSIVVRDNKFKLITIKEIQYDVIIDNTN